jgi:hypothetical protein
MDRKRSNSFEKWTKLGSAQNLPEDKYRAMTNESKLALLGPKKEVVPGDGKLLIEFRLLR